MKSILKRAGVPCGIYWAILLGQIFLLSIMTEEWMLLWLLMFVTARLMLWLSPFALTAFVWIGGMRTPRCSIKYVVLANVAVLMIDCVGFVAWHLVFDGWY